MLVLLPFLTIAVLAQDSGPPNPREALDKSLRGHAPMLDDETRAAFIERLLPQLERIARMGDYPNPWEDILREADILFRDTFDDFSDMMWRFNEEHYRDPEVLKYLPPEEYKALHREHQRSLGELAQIAMKYCETRFALVQPGVTTTAAGRAQLVRQMQELHNQVFERVRVYLTNDPATLNAVRNFLEGQQADFRVKPSDPTELQYYRLLSEAEIGEALAAVERELSTVVGPLSSENALSGRPEDLEEDWRKIGAPIRELMDRVVRVLYSEIDARMSTPGAWESLAAIEDELERKIREHVERDREVWQRALQLKTASTGSAPVKPKEPPSVTIKQKTPEWARKKGNTRDTKAAQTGKTSAKETGILLVVIIAIGLLSVIGTVYAYRNRASGANRPR